MEDGRHDPSVAGAIAGEYRARLAVRRATAARFETWHARLAWTRLGLLASAIALYTLSPATAPWTPLPVVLFLPLLFVHARVLNARDRAARAVTWYDHGLARLEGRWQGLGPSGERFQDPAHLYSSDLDLFGHGGLFDLLATPRTMSGENRLAGWLLAPSDRDTVVARQAAVAELAPRLDLHEDLGTAGPRLDHAVRTEDLRAWAAAPPQLPWRWPVFVLPVMAVASSAAMIDWIRVGEPPAALVPLLALQVSLALWLRHRVHHVAHEVEERAQELHVLAALLARVDREPVASPRLAALRAQVRVDGRSPADEVRRLARLVEILSSGHNQIFAPLAALWLVGTQLAFAVERWRARCGPAVPVWLDALAEYEALCAVAVYRVEHPADPFPVLLDGPARFAAEGLAHPLLDPADVVANDVALGGEAPHLWLMSGSNMSGKSTLLRTLGLNAVLAQAGAPVRATRLEMTPLRVGATLRIQDSLAAGRSRFFAEITRLRDIVGMAREPNGPAVLFLVDEILAGTNSHDRLIGASGILSGLVAHGAIGVATTHDLALAEVVDHLGARAANVHFEDRFDGGGLTFDYRIKPGIVRTSNALALMRAVGLEVD